MWSAMTQLRKPGERFRSSAGSLNGKVRENKLVQVMGRHHSPDRTRATTRRVARRHSDSRDARRREPVSASPATLARAAFLRDRVHSGGSGDRVWCSRLPRLKRAAIDRPID
jgi:hypothetical protein